MRIVSLPPPASTRDRVELARKNDPPTPVTLTLVLLNWLTVIVSPLVVPKIAVDCSRWRRSSGIDGFRAAEDRRCSPCATYGFHVGALIQKTRVRREMPLAENGSKSAARRKK